MKYLNQTLKYIQDLSLFGRFLGIMGKLKRQTILKTLKFVSLLMILQSCSLSDLRTQEIKLNNNYEESKAKAVSILEALVKKQGYTILDSNSTYEITAKDHWKGVMGKLANGWTWNNDAFKMYFTTQNFNGQVEVLEGEKQGFMAGIQDWNYYEKENGVLKISKPKHKGIPFMLAAFHYFFELGPRLFEAPFIRYMKEDVLFDQKVDKIFVSWGNEKSEKYDQYVLWINQTSGLIDAVTYTVREKYMISPNNVVATIRFTDYQEVDGVFIPFKQTIQMNQPQQNLEQYIHQLTIQEFKWNSFPASKLKPFPNLTPKLKK